ncbi:unnamed protein product [Amoebophrya sp. A25]|nr:unnamed protein product [Amoebophrya sp. A25]|eukprot:GSA25T00025408001.1
MPAKTKEAPAGERPKADTSLVASKGVLMARKQELYNLGARMNLTAVPENELFPAAVWKTEQQDDVEAVISRKSTMTASDIAHQLRPDGRLRWTTKVLFAMCNGGVRALFFSKDAVMKKFYTDDYPRANPGLMAMFMVLGVLVDAFTDPWFARITDNWVSKSGRRKPFLKMGMWFTPIIFILAYTPPDVGPVGTGIYYGIFHVLTKLADTITMIPLEAFGNELTSNYRERTNLWSWTHGTRMIMAIFGAVIVGSMKWGPDCAGSPDDGCYSYAGNTLFLGLFFYALPLFLLIKYIPERDYRLNENYLQKLAMGEQFSDEGLATSMKLLMQELKVILFGSTDWVPRDQMGRDISDHKGNRKSILGSCCRRRVQACEFKNDDIIPNFISTFLNEPFRILLVAESVEAIGSRFPYQVLPYIMTWVIAENSQEAEQGMAAVLTVHALMGLPSVYFWKKLASKIGKFRAFYIGLVFTFLTWMWKPMWYKYDAKLSSLMFESVIWAFFQSSVCLFNSLVNETIEYDEFLSGRRREGQYTMMKEFIPKFLELPAQFIPFVLMQEFKYDPTLNKDADGNVVNCPNDECQPKRVLMVLLWCMSYIPGVFYLGAGFALLWFPLRDEVQHEKVRAAMIDHSKGLAAVDPVYGHVCEAPATMMENPEFDAEDLAFEIYEKEMELKQKDPEAYAQLQSRASPEVQKLVARASTVGTTSRSMSMKKLRDSRRASVSAHTIDQAPEEVEAAQRVDTSVVRALPIYETRLLFFWPDEIRDVCILRTKNAVKHARGRRRSLEMGMADDEWKASLAEAYGYAPSRTLPHDVEIVRFEETDVGGIDFAGLFFNPRKGILISVCLLIVGFMMIFVDFGALHPMLASGTVRLVEKSRYEDEQRTGLAPFGLALAGFGILYLWYNMQRYEAAMSLWYEFVIHYDISKDVRSRKKTKLDEQQKIDLRDLKRQVFMVLNYYDSYTQGNRKRGTAWEQLMNFFAKMPVYEVERVIEPSPKLSSDSICSSTPLGAAAGGLSGSLNMAVDAPVDPTQSASLSVASGTSLSEDPNPQAADNFRERLWSAANEERAVHEAA